MQKLWLNSYAPGVPENINPEAYPSLVALLQSSVEKYRDLPALSHMDVVMSFRELDDASNRFAAYLQSELKVKKGDRVAIMLPNCLQYVVSLFGILKAGGIIVNVNPLYTPPELAHQLNNSGAKILILFENVATTVEKALPEIALEKIILTGIADFLPCFKRCVANLMMKYVKKILPTYHLPKTTPFKKVLKTDPRLCQPVHLAPQDLAFLQYTGGTTGVSKGAMLTHRNIIANIEQSYAWIGELLHPAAGEIITPLPLYHIFSLMASCLVQIRAGVKNILITNPRDIRNFAKVWRKHRVFAMMGVNTLFNSLANDPQFASLDFSHLKLVIAGGMALHGSVAKRWHQVTGNHILQGYGLTEASPIVTIGQTNHPEFKGSIGLPVSSTLVKITDDEGQELAVGEVGELCVSGPQVMQGYWETPEETAKVFDTQGWLKTGDMGKIDEQGFVYIVERKKDMIIISGFNVYPNEVEAALMLHPNILECAVIGTYHRKTGEAIKAFIVTKDGQEISKAELIAFCRQHLTGYKIPRRFEFRSFLPKSNVGKILRKTLRTEETATKTEA